MKKIILSCIFICSLTGCKNNRVDRESSELTISSIAPYCWCFMLKETTIPTRIVGDSLEELEPAMCLTYLGIRPDQILSDSLNAKAIISEDKSLKKFSEELLENSDRVEERKAIDSRLVLLINYSEAVRPDTFVYFNNEYYWLNGALYKSSRQNIDSILYEIGANSFCYCKAGDY
ncbi:hypothetical protein PPO43_14385 [Saprospira sp. CCB-QB6]|uniref:hypothetical protein n=1 Tax=Saprospira sp. CCB-QB6 TaxID=3023936 RepID=UPI00234B5F12|nr:hypothetical protein [Saprospira sp. CCB-QB6]WCL81159.1 hypothetical protein PPO43_14385 [Saprospira sp. CCB-QB6]